MQLEVIVNVVLKFQFGLCSDINLKSSNLAVDSGQAKNQQEETSDQQAFTEADKRASAQFIGCTAVIFLVVTSCILVILDAGLLYKHIFNR